MKAGGGSSISFTIEGSDKIIRKLKSMDRKIARKIMRQSLRDSAKRFKKAIEDEAPVDSGDLKKSVKVRSGKKSRNYVSVLAQIGEGFFKGPTWYAGAVHYGTSKLDPNPFIERAFENIKDSESRQLAKDIWQRIDESAKG